MRVYPMPVSLGIWRVFVALAAVATIGPATAHADLDLGRQAQGILQNHCHRCHGLEFRVEGLDVLDREALTRDRGADRPAYVVAGKASVSKLWQYVEDDIMPPGDQKLSKDEKEVLRKWIDDGAEFPEAAAAARDFVLEVTILKAIKK